MVLCIVIGLATPNPIRAEVDLQFDPSAQTDADGTSVAIKLLAVTDDAPSEGIGGMDIVITWDPDILSLIEADDDGPYPWLLSGFLPDPESGLNADLTDGDAMYTALSNFQKVALATPEGLRVTTFRFAALAPAETTTVAIEVQLGDWAQTVVFGDESPGQVVTGSLGSAAVRVTALDDVDADGDVDLGDFAAFQECFSRSAFNTTNASKSQDAVWDDCPVFDADDSGAVDIFDFATFMENLTGPIGGP